MGDEWGRVSFRLDKKYEYGKMGMKSIVRFGKYKGRSVESIFEKDPEYLVWMRSIHKKFSDEVEERLNNVKTVY